MRPLVPLLLALALTALAAAWYALGWVGALALGAVALLGGLAGLLLPARGEPAPRPAAVRKVPARAAAQPPAETLPRAGSRAVTTFVPVRGAAIAMEPGAARLADPHEDSLRLTGDILRGMRTGGKTTRGKCSQCDATLWLSARRPVKARCPVCGFSRVLT